jgi:hypothetical protein
MDLVLNGQFDGEPHLTDSITKELVISPISKEDVFFIFR